jgi:hypothetical protein
MGAALTDGPAREGGGGRPWRPTHVSTSAVDLGCSAERQVRRARYSCPGFALDAEFSTRQRAANH